MLANFSKLTCCTWLAVFTALFFAPAGVYAQSTAHPEVPRVTMVLSEMGGTYGEFSAALDKILVGKGVLTQVIDSTGTIPNSGLVIGVGMKAATAVAASDAPFVLNVLVPKAGHEKLLRDFPLRQTVHAYSAIYLDQPIELQVHLITAILPEVKAVGVLFSSPPEELAKLKKEISSHGLSLRVQKVNSEYPLAEALQIILDSSQVLLALPDAVVYNASTLRNILLSSYRNGVPLVGFSPSYVKAGALCAVFSPPSQIASQTAGLVTHFTATHQLPVAQFPEEFEVMVNDQVAHSLGLRIKGATTLHDQIKAANQVRGGGGGRESLRN